MLSATRLMQEKQRIKKLRLLTLLILPPFIASSFVLLANVLQQESIFEREQSLFGKSSAKQIARQIGNEIIENNLLSLHVMLTRLSRDEPIGLVAVYDENDKLIAQSGEERKTDLSYESEVTFQDSLIGRVKVTLTHSKPNTTLLVWILFFIAASYSVFVWKFLDSITLWLEIGNTTSIINDEEIKPLGGTETETSRDCILVVRVRPAKQLEKHFEKFFNAANLHGGIVEQTTPEELVIHFETPAAMYMAAYSGLLIQKVASKLKDKVTFGAFLDLVSHEPEKMRKAASYLASLSDGHLIAQADFLRLSDRVGFQSFHHPLIDSEGLLKVDGLTNPDLLNHQANQLAASD